VRDRPIGAEPVIHAVSGEMRLPIAQATPGQHRSKFEDGIADARGWRLHPVARGLRGH
jgi:hypothetical protein